jgi:hypothetical protein
MSTPSRSTDLSAFLSLTRRWALRIERAHPIDHYGDGDGDDALSYWHVSNTLLSTMWRVAGRIARANLDHYNGDAPRPDVRRHAALLGALAIVRYTASYQSSVLGDSLVYKQALAIEVERARAKFPSSRHAFAALIEEIGEAIDRPPRNVWHRRRHDAAETQQVVAMCARLAIEGDPAFEPAEVHHG